MKDEEYQDLKMEIIRFETEDVITASDAAGGGDTDPCYEKKDVS